MIFPRTAFSRVSARRGFTLIELLVCVAVIAVLLAILLPAVQQAREAARLTQCRNNLKQFGLAFHEFHDAYGKLPPAYIGNWYAAWPALILPYIEQSAAYNAWNFQQNYYEQNDTARLVNTSIFYCPTRRTGPQYSILGDTPVSTPGAPNIPGSLIDYAVCAGNNDVNLFCYEDATGASILGLGNWTDPGTLRPDASRTSLSSITDGTSQTLLLGEKHVAQGGFGIQVLNGVGYADSSGFNGDHCGTFMRKAGYTRPFTTKSDASARSNYAFGSWHAGIVNFTMCDGSGRSISYSVDLGVMDALSTRSGAEVVGEY